MEILKNQELFDEFYKLIKDDYKNLTRNQVQQIIRVPFNVLKENMQHSDFPNIRIQHLGTFTVLGKQEKALKEKDKLLKQKYDEFNEEYKKGSVNIK